MTADPKKIHIKKSDPKCRVTSCTKKGVFENGICDKCNARLNKIAERKPIKKVSDKRSKENAEYLKIRAQFMKDNHLCKVCGNKATDIHHKKGRENAMLFDVRYFLSVCRECHQKIELNPIWAKENGYSVNRTN